MQLWDFVPTHKMFLSIKVQRNAARVALKSWGIGARGAARDVRSFLTLLQARGKHAGKN